MKWQEVANLDTVYKPIERDDGECECLWGELEMRGQLWDPHHRQVPILRADVLALENKREQFKMHYKCKLLRRFCQYELDIQIHI